jgi:hypothetical protein
MLGTEAVSNDLRIRPHLLFVPLARPGPGGRRSIIVLGLAYVAVLGLAALAGNGIDGGEARNWIVGRMGAQNAAAFDAASATLSDTGAAVLALKIAVVALGSIPLWHAPALVQWGRMGARQAMFGSVVALWRTRAAFTVFLLGWFAVGLLGAIALDLLALLLQGSVLFAFVAVIVSWIISATFYVTLWFGFVDTFDIRRPASERAAAIDAGDAGP